VKKFGKQYSLESSGNEMEGCEIKINWIKNMSHGTF
jgi:hypothetical protein